MPKLYSQRGGVFFLGDIVCATALADDGRKGKMNICGSRHMSCKLNWHGLVSIAHLLQLRLQKDYIIICSPTMT